MVSYNTIQTTERKVCELMTLIKMVKYAWDVKMHGYPRDVGLVSQMHVTAHASRNTRMWLFVPELTY